MVGRWLRQVAHKWYLLLHPFPIASHQVCAKESSAQCLFIGNWGKAETQVPPALASPCRPLCMLHTLRCPVGPPGRPAAPDS